MSDSQQSQQTSLTSEEIQSKVLQRLKRYENLNFSEQFTMYMGAAQLVEINLKQLLHRRYAVEFESLERLTLGQVTGLLKDRGLRPDSIVLLESVVKCRNYIAHSLLANQIMLCSLGDTDARFERRELDRGIYEVEQLWFLYEWTEEHDAWG